MAYQGYLLKVGGVTVPLTTIKYETYKITPDQRLDFNSTRSTDGWLHRNALQHTATKLEYETPPMNSNQQANLMNIFRNAWTSYAERKCTVEYFDPEINGYKSGTFYMPDIQWIIRNVDNERGLVNYNQCRIAFIEY